MGEYESWGVPALSQLKADHPDYTITRSQLAEIIESSIEQLKQDGRNMPKWALGNFIADINEKTHQMYHRSRPRNNVCFHCLGSGEKVLK